MSVSSVLQCLVEARVRTRTQGWPPWRRAGIHVLMSGIEHIVGSLMLQALCSWTVYNYTVMHYGRRHLLSLPIVRTCQLAGTLHSRKSLRRKQKQGEGMLSHFTYGSACPGWWRRWHPDSGTVGIYSLLFCVFLTLGEGHCYVIQI